MRVGIIALQHESNTFVVEPTTLDCFEQDHLLTGEAVREFFRDSHHEVGGFLAGLDAAGIEAVPIFSARALPSGVIEAEAFRRLLDAMFTAVEGAGDVDGWLVAPHGAAVSQEHRDADGFWLGELRRRVGSEVPVVCTIDPHANVSLRMIAACDATLSYRTNPHIDQRERGSEAAALLGRILNGEVRVSQAILSPPVAINIERQRTADEPCLKLYEKAEEIRRRRGVLAVSIVLGFPYADVHEMGSSLIVATQPDEADAQAQADELADYLWQHRDDFVGTLTTIDEALDNIEQAGAIGGGPVLLLDMGDNVGGGSPGDGTLLAEALHRRKIHNCAITLFDPESVEAAVRAGVGQSVALKVGGKTDDRHGAPLAVEVEVTGIHDGKFRETQPRHGGWTEFDMGRTAVVETSDALTFVLTSRRLFPVSLGQWPAVGIDPESLRVIVAKGVHAPVAAYEPICSRMIRVNTPGVTTADMESLDYRNRRRPLFPFERDVRWAPGEPKPKP